MVGFLFSIWLIHGKHAGKDTYAIVFVLLAFLAYGVYSAIRKVHFWLFSLPLWVKIFALLLIVLAVVGLIIAKVMVDKKANNTAVERSDVASL